jgi:membrane protein YqaA with SNARE-associated domain
VSEKAPDPRLTSHRARFSSLTVVLAIESLAVIGLVAGALWLVQSFWKGRGLASPFLDPRLWLLVVLFSALGTAGNLAQYYLGKLGTEEIFARFPQLEDDRWEWLEAAFQRWGVRTLVLSGIPTLGAVLATAAGAFGIQRRAFLRWDFLGKILRNAVLALALLCGIQILEG